MLKMQRKFPPVQRVFQLCTRGFGCDVFKDCVSSAGFHSNSRHPFGTLDERDIDHFTDILGASSVVTDGFELAKYNSDWLGKYHGASRVALRPKSTKEVSSILGYCNEKNLAVVPQGGNTGLVGGSVPLYDELVLNMSDMKTIHGFDANSGVVVCDAGVVLHDLETYLQEKEHTVPLDLGASGSCQIGGNVSTNAGGLRLLRYGSLHGSVMGLEVALSNGEVLDLLNTNRKDNTGIDLKHLFIGSEGTLGVVTKVALACPRISSSVNLGYFACNSFQDTISVLRLAKTRLNEILSAFEFLDHASIAMALHMLPYLRNPLHNSDIPSFAVVVETRGSNRYHDQEKMDSFLEECMAAGLIIDGAVAQDTGQARGIWSLRESVTEALRVRGATYKYDISIPTDRMYEIVEEARERMSTLSSHQAGQKPGSDGYDDIGQQDTSSWKVVGYGHLGDGNLHLNVSVPEYSDETKSILEPWIYQKVAKMSGSISAEHGIGQMKAAALFETKPQNILDMMRHVKLLLDPKGILNPYKIL